MKINQIKEINTSKNSYLFKNISMLNTNVSESLQNKEISDRQIITSLTNINNQKNNNLIFHTIEQNYLNKHNLITKCNKKKKK